MDQDHYKNILAELRRDEEKDREHKHQQQLKRNRQLLFFLSLLMGAGTIAMFWLTDEFFFSLIAAILTLKVYDRATIDGIPFNV